MPTHRRLRYRGRRKARYRGGWVTLHRTGFAPVGRQTKFHDITASSLPFDQPCLVALCTNAAFRHRALVQRCQWHKRENVVSYVAKREQRVWRQRLQRAYNRPEYDEALAALQSLQHELEDRNHSAAGSLAEGLDDSTRP